MASNYVPNFNPNTTTMQTARRGEIPINISQEIIAEAKHGSAFMKLAKAVAMTKPIEEFTYSSGVGAYWVNEAERIQTDNPRFVQAEMRAHKMGVIIPTTKENLKHSIPQFFELMRPEITEAFHKKIDQAAFSGIDSPWKQSVLSVATDAGNIVEETDNKYNDFNTALGMLEKNDNSANGIATTRSQKVKYRASKDGNGHPMFNSFNSNNVDDILGVPIAYTPASSFGGQVKELIGNWDYARYGILDNIEFEILTEATLTTVSDEEGNALSLAERDMVALKATFSIGILIVNEEAFSVIKPEDATPPEPEPEPEIVELANKSISQLQELLSVRGLEYPAKATKSELIKLLS